MASKDDVLQHLETVRKKFENPDTKAKFVGFDRILEFRFTDLELSFHTRVHDQIMEPFTEGSVENPNLLVITDSGTLIGILEGNFSPLDAYSIGKLKAKGSMTDLLKLQVLM
jgi:putative sterol carrier protein